MAGILSPFKAIGRGILGGIDRGVVNTSGGYLDPQMLTKQQRGAARGAFLSDLGDLFLSRGQAGSAVPNLTNSIVQQQQQAAEQQKQEQFKQQMQAAAAQGPEALRAFALANNNPALANAAGQAIPEAPKAPEIVDPNKLVTVDGPNGPVSGFYTADKQFNQVERQPIPGTDIEIITDATGAKRAVNKASLRGGEVLAEGKAEEKRYVTFERNGQTYVGDPASRTAAPFVDENGKPIQEIPKPATSEDRFSDTLRLGQAYTAELKDTTQIVRAYAKLQAAAADPSAAGDLSIIFSYMKMLDPGSTVREGEQATAENARSVPDSIRARWNKVIAGEKLGPDQRADFINKAKALVTSQRGDAERTAGRYRSLAKASGLNPDLVTFDPFEGISTGVSDEEFDSLFK